VVVVGIVVNAIQRHTGISSNQWAETVAGAILTIRSVADQSTPPDCRDLDKPDLHLDFSDRVLRLLRVDLTLEGLKLHYIVAPSV